MKQYCAILLVFYFFMGATGAQTRPPFWDDVQTIKNYDKIYSPPLSPVLFIGSSTIRKWDNMQHAFPGYNTLNRGVGGAVINDISYYLTDLVFPYKPKQIVLYVGDNDLVSPKATADTILNRTIDLYTKIRAQLPDVPIAYISIKPSPSRNQYRQKAIDANRLIRDFLEKQKNSTYIDIFPLMLAKNGEPRSELFLPDMLHMNQLGYNIWEKAVKPYLIKK